MLYTKEITTANMPRRLNLSSVDFANHKYAYYKYLREHEPLHHGVLLAGIKGYFVSRYDDCMKVLKDPRFVRVRSTAKGGKQRSVIPLPKSVVMLTNSMISQDDPQHKRLRNLVHKAFTPKHLAGLEDRVAAVTHELLDKVAKQNRVELREEVARPIPVTVIAEMMGVDLNDMPQFVAMIQALTQGMTGTKVIATIMWRMPRIIKFVRGIIERKRQNPGNDILTGLIEAEEEGEKLSEDELVAMVFLIIIGGYETTYNLITNAMYTLIGHPAQLALLREKPELMDMAIEEVLRYNGPVQGTKMQYACEAIDFGEFEIPKGATVMPFLGAANHDGGIFENPGAFDITRDPKRHLAFGMGIHYCLGAPLARMETKIALSALLERFKEIELAIPGNEVVLTRRLGWQEYKELPLQLR